uniref:Uncharacterized protein n=1 Tax=Arundo donax TaxID=35708 RepID=A0A0A9DNP5_ARUDO
MHTEVKIFPLTESYICLKSLYLPIPSKPMRCFAIRNGKI